VKILILSASVGAGHGRAAEALEAAFQTVLPKGSSVRHIDVLQLTNSVFRRIYGKAYFDLFRLSPHLLGYFYDYLDRPARGTHFAVGDRLRLLTERANFRRLTALLRKERWDLIVNTHFLPAEIIASMRRRGTLTVPQATVTTDYDTHRLWVNQPCEHYFTATPEGAAYLHYVGVPSDDLSVTGIPVHPSFAKSKGREVCREKHGFLPDRPAILQLAGGFGVGPVEIIFKGLLGIERPLTVAVVSGSNAEVRERLEKIPVPSRHAVRILGFSKEIDELMEAADLLVSKPGGLTSSEALTKGLPLAIVNPIPGQESRNSDFLLEAGAAVKINNLCVLGEKVGGLLGEPERLAAMKENALRAARPLAAITIAKRCLSLVDKKRSGGPRP
jgi:processive 1,2-diacylglycerol beta-glucosyltransferase